MCVCVCVENNNNKFIVKKNQCADDKLIEYSNTANQGRWCQPMVPNLDGRMGYRIKTKNHPRHETQFVLEYRVPNKQKPSTIPSRKCNNCVLASLVQLAG